jgi:hypothetical protein
MAGCAGFGHVQDHGCVLDLMTTVANTFVVVSAPTPRRVPTKYTRYALHMQCGAAPDRPAPL